MKDPYEVLGLRPDADEAEIKSTYRELAKKYHPDNYANNPLADLANEKMKEINEAYDAILRERAGGASEGGYTDSHASSPEWTKIRELIASGRYAEAELTLDGMSGRGAEWHFLKGLCFAYTNRYNHAAMAFQTAYQSEPGNREYETMYQRFRSSQRSFGGFGGRSNEGSICDLCSALLCADCLCECCGGDLISCC